VVVHFAAQRAAPYSMSSPQAKRYTVDNNVRATHNLLVALVATGGSPALVHLGSMGVYGYEWPAQRADSGGLPDRHGADAGR
jgi:UDP-sulfoquinovose synthase